MQQNLVPEPSLHMTAVMPPAYNDEETTMRHIDTQDFLSDFELDLNKEYPSEVLNAEWNPVVAQFQLLKRRRQQEQQNSSLLPLYMTNDREIEL